MFENICLNCFKDNGGYDVCPHCGFVKGTLPEQEYYLYPGTILNERYLIGTVLGFGGFGITYKAWDMKLGSVVAVKEFYPAGLVNRVPGTSEVLVFDGKEKTNFREALERFLDEAKNLAQFNGRANIVNVFGYFEENNTAYYVMEFLDGISLKDYIEKNGKMTVDVAAAVILDLLNGIGEVHEKGILHRDIAPDNIIITNDGVVKILDFGSARFSAVHSEKTLSAFIKPGYAAPEQYASNGKQGVWTDIYGLGATLYYAVTGVKPEESTDRRTDDKLKRPSELGIDLPVEIDKSIMKAMAIETEFRFKSVDEFIAAIQGDYEIEYPDVEIKKRKKKRIILASISAACFIAAIAFVVFIYNYLRVDPYENIKDKSDLLVWVYVDNKDYNPGMSYLPDDFKSKVMENKADQYEKQKEAYENLMAAFKDYMKQYADINTNILVFDSKEGYEESLLEAAEKNELPDMFYVAGVYNDISDKCKAVDEIENIFSGDSLNFIDEESYAKYYPDKKLVPLGFNSPVVYVNKSLISDYNISPDMISDEFSSVEQFEALDKYAGESKITSTSKGVETISRAFGIDESAFGELVALYGSPLGEGENKTQLSGENVKLISRFKNTYEENEFNPAVTVSKYFYLGQLACMAGDTSVFEYVNNYLGGNYDAIPVTDNGRYAIRFCTEIAFNSELDENSELLARAFAEYLLSDDGQQYINSVVGASLPINKDIIKEYADSVNPNLSFISSIGNDIVAIGQSKFDGDKLSEEAYNDYCGEDVPIPVPVTDVTGS